MNCEAISRRSSRQCGNGAETERKGCPLCEVHATMFDQGKELSTLRGALVPGTGAVEDGGDPPGGPSTPPSTPPTPGDTPPETAPLREIPAAQDPEETPGERPSQPSPDLGELDRIAGELKILSSEATPRSSCSGPQIGPAVPPGPAPAAAAQRPQLWTPEKVAEWIAWANPWLERAGMRPLTADEVRSGGEAWAEPFNIILAKIDPNNPWIGAIAWSAVTLAPRAMEKGRQLAEAKTAQEEADAGDVQELRPRSPERSAAATAAAASWAPDRSPAAA